MCHFYKYTNIHIFCMSLQSVILINNAHQNSTRNVQKRILLTKYNSIKPIHISNNVQHTTSKVNMKRSAIPCIPVYSPMAYDNLFLHYRKLCIAPTIRNECLYRCEKEYREINWRVLSLQVM